MWLEGLGALEYIGEDGGNCYEAKKFCGATGLLLSESLLDMASTGDMGDRGWCVGNSENPSSRKSTSEAHWPGAVSWDIHRRQTVGQGKRVLENSAGWFQRHPPGFVRLFDVRRGEGYIAVAKASDQGVEYYYQADITGAS